MLWGSFLSTCWPVGAVLLKRWHGAGPSEEAPNLAAQPGHPGAGNRARRHSDSQTSHPSELAATNGAEHPQRGSAGTVPAAHGPLLVPAGSPSASTCFCEVCISRAARAEPSSTRDAEPCFAAVWASLLEARGGRRPSALGLGRRPVVLLEAVRSADLPGVSSQQLGNAAPRWYKASKPVSIRCR